MSLLKVHKYIFFPTNEVQSHSARPIVCSSLPVQTIQINTKLDVLDIVSFLRRPSCVLSQISLCILLCIAGFLSDDGCGSVIGDGGAQSDCSKRISSSSVGGRRGGESLSVTSTHKSTQNKSLRYKSNTLNTSPTSLRYVILVNTASFFE